MARWLAFLGMRGRTLLAAVLIVVAIRCVPGRLGVVDLGAIVPPMPLRSTPEGSEQASVPSPTPTPTPSPARTPSPTPASPADLFEPQPIPDCASRRTLAEAAPALPALTQRRRGAADRWFPIVSRSVNIAGLTTRGEVGEWLKPAVC